MAETSHRTRPWVGCVVLIAICAVLIFIQLLPLDTLPRSWAAPDLMLVVTLAWVTRRPDYAPALVIGALFLLADLLFQRPPGLMTALVIIVTEMLRARSRALRTVPFPLEWATVSLGILAIAIINRAVLALVLMPLPSMTLTLSQVALTCLSYPVIVGLAYAMMGFSRPAPGEVDALGHRL